jgi:hypothetical protein
MKIRIKRANTVKPAIEMLGYVLTLRHDNYMLAIEYLEELRQAAIWAKRGE